MQFGVCAGPELAEAARQAGYSYFEWSVPDLLAPDQPEEVFQAALSRALQAPLPCPALNRFLPPALKVAGPLVDRPAVKRYIETALRRAETAQIETIVFGAGGARAAPEGFDMERAFDQLAALCLWMAPHAENHGVRIAVEPLNTGETNVINTVAEGARLVRAVNHCAIRLLVDGYHWAKDLDTAEGILDNADLLIHAHIAAVEGRRPPDEDDPCAEFLSLLKEAGYQGRLSFEGSFSQPEAPKEELDCARAVMLRSLE